MSIAPMTLRSRRVITPQGVVDASVEIADGRIVSIRTGSGANVDLDLGDLVLMPGIVDTHVHVNEPGRTEWEGFATATSAAAAGGITTLVDMPLNSIPATTSVVALEAKREAARAKAIVDVGFWGGVVPGNARELEPLARAGVLGFKCFLVPSGVDEFGHVGESDLREAMPVIARLGLPLLVHAELPGPIDAALTDVRDGDPRSHGTWLDSRPPAAEVEAIRLMIRLCREIGCRVHIVHLAAADALDDLRAARREGLPITVETCPHYLTFTAEEIPDGATHFKCAPPIRDRENRERLWAALLAGDIDLVATDHSPCPPAMKHLESGEWATAWGGIASLEMSLAATWTGARAHGASLEHLARWMCEGPARLAGLDRRKGRIAEGHDADLVAWDPDAEWRVDPTTLRQRHRVTPYADRVLRGVVRKAFVRGRAVFDGEVAVTAPSGQLLLRESG